MVECPEVARIALASARTKRDLWLAAFALDGRIGRMVLGASEPLLGQMRIAWWRDQLGKPIAQRPRGDVLLDQIGKSWSGGETELVALIDGWEALLAPRPLEDAVMAQFVEGRATLAAGLAERLGHSNAVSEAGSAGKLWAFADLAVHARHDVERSLALEHGMRLSEQGLKLPKTLRPLALIGGLARRSLRKGGQEMLGDRLSPLVALRLGLSGR